MKKIIFLLIFLLLIVAFFYFDWQRYLTLDQLKQHQQYLAEYYQQHIIITVTIFFLIYVLVTALSLPGAVILTLAAGAVFGLFIGTLIVSFASAIGATCACFLSRYLFGHLLQHRYREKLEQINTGIEKDGAYYLFSLRLVPLFPFFAINLLMGLTRMRLWTFYWVSQLGMLIGTIVYINAGTQLAKVDQAKDILSWPLIVSFLLLGLFPVAAKKTLVWMKTRTRASNL